MFGIVFGNCQNGKYLASIMDDPMIICDEVFESCNEKIKTIPTNFNEKKLNAVFFCFTCIFIDYYNIIETCSIYCYLIKYQEIDLLPFYETKLKQLCIDNIN